MQRKLRDVLFLIGICLVAPPSSAFAHTDVTVAEALDLVASVENLVVVDVREPSEYCDARGHIPVALNYPLHSGVLQARYEELPMDRPILVVCRSGGRSNVAATFLDGQGFAEVYDMMGGMNAWTGETEPCKYSGGSGTADDPYRIATSTDLTTLGETPEDYDKHFILTADIDFGRQVFDRAVIAPDVNDVTSPWGWNPFDGVPFTGVFKGDGHTISHLTVAGGGYLGLFGQLAPGAEVSNLHLEVADVNGVGSHIGVLAGYNLGRVAMCHSTGMVNGEGWDIGGLVGSNGNWPAGAISNCHSNCAVNGGHGVGGLVGHNGGTIANSYSEGVTTGTTVGGLVGYNSWPAIITACYSSGTVRGPMGPAEWTLFGGWTPAGGLVGENSGSINRSYSNANVAGGIAGGLAGRNYDAGQMGSIDGDIAECYSTGKVTGREVPEIGTLFGGLVGGNGEGSITSSFWDMETSGCVESSGGTGLTTAEMQDINTYISAGWDLADEVLNGHREDWLIAPGNYPRLRYQDSENLQMPEGRGTAEQPYLIRDAADLGTVWLEPLAHYRLETSLDLSVTTWSMAVVPWFEGVFNGSSHMISNLHMQGRGYLGLFGRTGSRARISDLVVEAVDVNGTGYYVGGLVGDNEGRITNGSSAGRVGGEHEVGGLVGYNRGSITNSCSTATVTGDVWVGGLVGENRGGISNSCSTATVTGDAYVAGLVGRNEGSIANSYSTATATGRHSVAGLVGTNVDGSITSSYCSGVVTGDVGVGGLVGHTMFISGGSITSCFWDLEISGQDISAGGIGKTSAEMQTASTFLEAGWDFIDEIENGTDDIWWILEGEDTPRLWWELDEGQEAEAVTN